MRDDRILDQSAKLSFYFLLSAFPLLYFLTALLGLVLSRSEAAVAQLQAALAAVAPAAAATLIDATVAEIVQGSGGLVLSAIHSPRWRSDAEGARSARDRGAL